MHAFAIPQSLMRYSPVAVCGRNKRCQEDRSQHHIAFVPNRVKKTTLCLNECLMETYHDIKAPFLVGAESLSKATTSSQEQPVQVNTVPNTYMLPTLLYAFLGHILTYGAPFRLRFVRATFSWTSPFQRAKRSANNFGGQAKFENCLAHISGTEGVLLFKGQLFPGTAILSRWLVRDTSHTYHYCSSRKALYSKRFVERKTKV